jgi:hypothetical protein
MIISLTYVCVSMCRTFQVWLFVVTLVPLFAFYLFQNHWSGYLQQAGAALASIALGTAKGK